MWDLRFQGGAGAYGGSPEAECLATLQHKRAVKSLAYIRPDATASTSSASGGLAGQATVRLVSGCADHNLYVWDVAL